jgi:hypothetical protein
MRRLSQLSSDEIREYNAFLRRRWPEIKAKSFDGKYEEPSNFAEYVKDMDYFCDLVEEFSDYLAQQAPK